MKQKITSIVAIGLFLSVASAIGFGAEAKEVFRCVAKIDSYDISITVLALPDGRFQSSLEGSIFDEPVPTKRAELNRDDGLRRYGVSDVADAVKLTRTDYSRTTKIVIYEAGDFQDDAAGVLGVEFLDSYSVVIKSGMYFAWAGPQACIPEND